MNCHEISEQVLSDYVDHETPPELARRIREHLLICPHCRVQVRTMTTTITLTRRLEGRGAQREMIVRLRRRIIRVDRG